MTGSDRYFSKASEYGGFGGVGPNAPASRTPSQGSGGTGGRNRWGHRRALLTGRARGAPVTSQLLRYVHAIARVSSASGEPIIARHVLDEKRALLDELDAESIQA